MKIKEQKPLALCEDPTPKKCRKCALGIVSNSLAYHIIATVIKGGIGFLTGSQVLVAEAVHSFTDSVAFGINYYGASKRQADIFWQSVFIGTITFLSGVWICADNIAIMISETPSHPGLMGLVVSVIAFFINLYLYRTSKCILANNPDDSNVLLCKIQNKINCFASAIASVGIFLSIVGFVYLDPGFAFLIGCFQIIGSFNLFKEGFEKQGELAKAMKKRVIGAISILTVLILIFFTQDIGAILEKRNTILIPSEGVVSGSLVSPLLARAKLFYLVNKKYETSLAIINRSWNAPWEVGNNFMKITKDYKVGVVLAQKIGSEMFSFLIDENVQMFYLTQPMTVAEAFSAYEHGKLKLATSSNVDAGFGRSKVRWFSPW